MKTENITAILMVLCLIVLTASAGVQTYNTVKTNETPQEPAPATTIEAYREWADTINYDVQYCFNNDRYNYTYGSMRIEGMTSPWSFSISTSVGVSSTTYYWSTVEVTDTAIKITAYTKYGTTIPEPNITFIPFDSIITFSSTKVVG